MFSSVNQAVVFHLLLRYSLGADFAASQSPLTLDEVWIAVDGSTFLSCLGAQGRI